MWSKELTELSEEYLEYDGTHVKHQKGIFGILNMKIKSILFQLSPTLLKN
jgi:hypothetical protein